MYVALFGVTGNVTYHDVFSLTCLASIYVWYNSRLILELYDG